MRRRHSIPVLVLLSVSLSPAALAVCPRPAKADELVLTPKDREFLDGLLKRFVFDPKGTQRARVLALRRSVWARHEQVEREGWLMRGKAGRPARVYFTDGDSIPAPPERETRKVDFVAACRVRLAKQEKAADDDYDFRGRFRQMRQTAVGAAEEPDLVLAAWLYRLGHDDLAAKALARARTAGKDPVAELRDGLAWSAFAGLVHAYMVRADDEALTHRERLLRLYEAESAKAFPQAKVVVDDLRRRKEKGTFGKEPAGLPDGFDGWETNKKVAHLIDALDEVDARQWGQPGGVDLASDARVAALIKIGDPAVPALIDAVEKDGRLTRSVHFWRDFARSRTVLGVREAALVAVMSILRTQVFEPASTGDNFTARDDNAAKQTADRLRAHSSTPFSTVVGSAPADYGRGTSVGPISVDSPAHLSPVSTSPKSDSGTMGEVLQQRSQRQRILGC
jgi:hypothetical protein